MTDLESAAELCTGALDTAVAELFEKTGIDLSTLPAIATHRDLAPVINSSIGALAQERSSGTGIPYLKLNRRVRYSRAEVALYLLASYKPVKAGR
jgi:hypothetical protein